MHILLAECPLMATWFSCIFFIWSCGGRDKMRDVAQKGLGGGLSVPALLSCDLPPRSILCCKHYHCSLSCGLQTGDLALVEHSHTLTTPTLQAPTQACSCINTFPATLPLPFFFFVLDNFCFGAFFCIFLFWINFLTTDSNWWTSESELFNTDGPWHGCYYASQLGCWLAQ